MMASRISAGARTLTTLARLFSSSAPPIQKRVLVAVANGSEELETVSIVDILRRTQTTEVVLAKVDSNEEASEEMLRSNALLNQMSRQVLIQADSFFKDLDHSEFDAIVLPGGLKGAEAFSESPQLVEVVKTFLEEGKLVGAICAAPALVLNKHDLIEKYEKITSFPAFKEQIVWSGDHNAEYLDSEPVAVSKNLVTSQGPGTSVEFSLKLVELLYDKEKALGVANPLVLKCSKEFYKQN
uniref:DJ-1/PfpI domain-containing protein n=1 Tax=Strombidium rassoulzadegani TaxID=1082188 RepID=A0A7S3FV99_9SPIT|mmetsp:Transcript_11038/g.18459  ORF Transcript_11038/g.18459 Transcript_11038/m.18459 type:complete len:240 (+) Transcript_11038:33-752(+)